MDCIKQKDRNLLDFFDIYTCDTCKFLNRDYNINNCEKGIIGFRFINQCFYFEDNFLYSVKMLYIYQEIIRLQALVLWFDNYYEFTKFYEIIDEISPFYDNVIIIIYR